LVITTDAGDVGSHNCRIVIKSSGVTLVDKTIVLTVYASVARNLKILMIGDSLLATGCGYYATAIDGLFTGTKTYIGTEGTTTKHEGYSGASFYQFLTSDLIALVKAGELNVPDYFSDNSLETPDIVHIRLGVNSVFYNSNGLDNALNSEDENIAYAKELIDALLDYDDKLQIIIGLPTICNISEAKWNEVYDESVYNMNLYNRLMHEFWSRLVTEFADGAYDDRVDCSYEAVFMSRSNYVDVVHPTATGYGQLGIGMGFAIDSKAALFTIESTGTGAAVTTLRMTTSSTQTLTLLGNAKFYTDSGGTAGESTTWNLTSGAERTIYLKCTSGSGNLCIPNPSVITKWGSSSGTDGWASSTNASRIKGDISKLSGLTELRITGYTEFTGAIANSVSYIYVSANFKWTYSGALPTSLTFLWVTTNLFYWTYDGAMPAALAYHHIYSSNMNWTGLDIGDTGNSGNFELGNYRIAKMSSADMITLLTQMTNRTGTLPATVTINDYADYASPPAGVTDAVDALKAAKSVTTVNLGA
jgi:hypothetical protein